MRTVGYVVVGGVWIGLVIVLGGLVWDAWTNWVALRHPMTPEQRYLQTLADTGQVRRVL